MISFEKRLIYIHIPKTGGYTLKKILNPYSPDQLSQVTNRYNESGLSMIDDRTKENIFHPSVRFYKQHYSDVYEHFTKFAIVRNPWDRMISYMMWLNKGKFDNELFMTWLDLNTTGIFNSTEDVNQISMLTDNTGKCDIDVMIKYSEFNKIMYFFEARGIESSLITTKTNSVHKKHYTEYCQYGLKEKIEKVCKPDIDFFGFTYDGDCKETALWF